MNIYIMIHYYVLFVYISITIYSFITDFNKL